MLSVFETAARYQLLHALALFGAAWTTLQWPGRWANASVVLFCAGITLFSGSLYVLALTGERMFGAVTPLGGGLLILGWLALALAPLHSDS
jgi:uncharacterized membrane protein YgdD (TMEM256/DUF423 family)